MAERGGEESKLDYLKNLMVNYLTSDQAVRDHMEGAIGTVLQFTPEDLEKIQKKKAESWF
jgi:GRIP domain